MEICKDNDLRAIMSNRYLKIDEQIEKLTDDEIMSGQDDVIINNLYETHKFFPVVIDEEIIENRIIKQTKVEQYNPFYNMYPSYMEEPKYFYPDGVELTCFFPYNGDDMLFYCYASTRSLGGCPEIELFNGYFTISESETLSVMSEEKNKELLFKRINDRLEQIKKHIGWCNTDVENFNKSLKSNIESRLNKRKEKVEKFYNISKMLEIPIEKKNTKVIEEIKVERKIIPLVVKDQTKNSEYSISDNAYNDIINVIKHQCATFERTPGVYNKLQEEDLRDIILSTLNATFQGKANGECFRKKGKTDISIEYENRAAFITECKIWGGKKILAEALFQLQSYTTWRDNKLCLIMFSRNKDFFKVLEEIKNNLSTEDNYVSHKELEKNIFELKLKSKNNEGQIILVTIFAFDLSV